MVVALGACSPDPIEAEVEPETATSCDDLIPTGEALAVQLLAAVESVPIEVLTGDEPPEGQLAELFDKGKQFDQRVEVLECDSARLNREIMDRIGGDLEPDSLAGVILREIMLSGGGPTSDTDSGEEG